MSTGVSYVKGGTKIQCGTSTLPRPRPKMAWPIPTFPGTSQSFLTLALVTVAETARKGVRVSTTAAGLPGSSAASWTLLWTAYQGGAPDPLTWNAVPVQWPAISLLLENVTPSATVEAYLQRVEAGQTTRYPRVQITTPADPTQGNISDLQNALIAAASDGVLSVGEKPQWIATYSGLASQVATLRAQASAVGATLPAQNTLLAYLQSLGAAGGPSYPWDDTAAGHDTVIPNPSAWTGQWNTAYSEIAALTANIAAALNTGIGTKLPASGTAANSLLLAGYAPDTAGNPNTIVRRDSTGGISAASGAFGGMVSTSNVVGSTAVIHGYASFGGASGGGTRWGLGAVGNHAYRFGLMDGSTWAFLPAPGDLTLQIDGGLTATTGTFNEITAARSGAITRINIYSDAGYGSSLYSYVNGQPRTVLSTDATNWSIGTWNAAGAWVDNPIVIPITGGAISVNRGLNVTGNSTMSGALSFTATTGGVQPGTITYNGSCGLGFWAKTGSTYDLTVWDASGNYAWMMPTGTRHLQLGVNSRLKLSMPQASATAEINIPTATGGDVLAIGTTGSSFSGLSWMPSDASFMYVPNNRKFYIGGATAGASGIVVSGTGAFSGNLTAPNVVSGDNATKTTNRPHSVASLSDPLPSGFYDSAGATDMPTTTWYHCINSAHTGSYAGNQYQLQIAAPFWGRNKLYFRTLDSANVTGGWQEIYHAGNIDTAPASLQALKSLVNAPQVGPFASRPAASSYPKGYYYATDATAPDGLLGALYYSDGTSWSAAQNPQTIAGRVICGTLSAGAAGVTSIAAQMAMTGTIQSLPFTAGNPVAPPSGFKLSGTPFPAACHNGDATGARATTPNVYMEIGGDSSHGVALCGFDVSALALARLINCGYKAFTSSGTWVCPAGITMVEVALIGGGGGGTGGGGGGGGGIKVLVPVTPGATYPITIGAGGAPGANGGDTTFTGGIITTVSARGGGGGTNYSSGYGGGAGYSDYAIPNLAGVADQSTGIRGTCYPGIIGGTLSQGGTGGFGPNGAGGPCGGCSGGPASADLKPGGGASPYAPGAAGGASGTNQSRGAGGGGGSTYGSPGYALLRW